MNNPRTPTRQEVFDIKNYLVDQLAMYVQEDLAEIADSVDSAYISVFDDYMSAGPGPTGRVIIVLYDGGPELVETYGYNQFNQLYRAKSL